MRTLDHGAAHEYLAGLEPATPTTVLHLLSCPTCRRDLPAGQTAELQALLVTLGSGRPRSRPGQADSDPVRLGLEVAVAVELADRVEALPIEAARRQIARDPELRQPVVARALLHRADDSLHTPDLGARLADLAIEILAPLAAAGREAHLELLVRAYWHRLRSLGRLGHLRQADDAYRSALPLLAALPPGSDARATLLIALAQLRWRQRRGEEAATLWSHAGRAFAEATERQGEAASRLQAGFAFLAQGHTARARAELALAHAHVDAELAPALAARASLALAWCNSALGLLDQARERLRGARGLYLAAPGSGEEAFRAWWEGRIAALDRQHHRAVRLLDTARRDFLAHGSVAEAAACTLDLLPLREPASPGTRPVDLAGDLAAAFAGSPLAAATARRIAELAATAPGTLRQAAIAALWRELAELPAGADTGDGDRSALIPDLHDLADQLLVDAKRGFAARM